MTYKDLQIELKTLLAANPKVKCTGFEESLEFKHFRTFFELKDAPNYAILQAKESAEYQTTEDMWYLTYLQDSQRVVIDIADELTICDEFYQLMVIWLQGCQTVLSQEK